MPTEMDAGGRSSDNRAWMRVAMILIYGGIGLIHLTAPDSFLPIMPDWVPQPRRVVLLTGLAEIAGALALLHPNLRRPAGIMLALYAICVFPANLKHAVENIPVPPIPQTWWYHGPRLALQPIMVWWALYAVHAIDWPLHRRSTKPKS